MSSFGFIFEVKRQNNMTFSAKDIFESENLDSPLDFVELSRKGISMKVLKKIQEFTSLTSKEISQILPVSERQLVRYSLDHMLRKDISSHLIQIVELFDTGYDIFGEEKFQRWIRSEIIVLDDRCPIDFMDTPIGINMIEDILGRIEHGVLS